MPGDIVGVWSPAENIYLDFSEDYVVHNVVIEDIDGKTVGDWTKDAYFYEPGYNMVVYVGEGQIAEVYQIVEMNDKSLTWCLVDEVDAANEENLGHMVGDIINKAQEGYELNPELYQSFKKVPEEEFMKILESLDVFYPWWDE